jgi:hypothetical protein
VFSEHQKIPLKSKLLYQRGTPVDLFNSERWNKSGPDRLLNTGETMVCEGPVKEMRCACVR